MHTNRSYHHSPTATWVVVADNAEAHIYNYRQVERVVPFNGTGKLHYYHRELIHELAPVSNGDLAAETIDSYQTGHQQRGTSVNNLSHWRNTYEPTGNIKEDLRRRFVKAIAAKLEQFYAAGLFDQLVIAAPARLIGTLREQLSKELQNHIIGVLPKDLTAYEGERLMAHLQDTLTEAQLA